MEEFNPANPDDAAAPLADVIYQRLLDAIYQGQLAPGDVINEVALSQKYGASRGPVREAVRRLQGLQLITRQPYVKSRVITLSIETAIELFQLRMALESMACNLAARRMNDADIDQLLHELENNRSAAKAGTATPQATPYAFDFHERIVRACGNSRIINALCGDLYHLLRIYRRHSTNTMIERKEDAYEEHWQILHAMKARDAQLAESLMRSHISRATENLVRQLGAPDK